MQKDFCPILWVLSVPINFQVLSVRVAPFLLFFMLISRSFGGIFGISVPANYGQWFTSIYQTYLGNQDLITNARRAYTAYLAVSNAVDALGELDGATREEFTTRWRRNMRVMLETQLWFEVDESLWGGGEVGGAVGEVLTDLLGLSFDETGNVSINPSLIETLAIKVGTDADYWEQRFLDTSMPILPDWFFSRAVYLDVSGDFLSNQTGMAFESFQQALRDRMTTELLTMVSSNPLWFLSCEDKSPCYSPFNFYQGSSGDEVSWSWSEMLANMYDTSLPLHSVNPLPGELVYEGRFISEYGQYLHRRVCSMVWREMGRELKSKLTKLHSSFVTKCNEINATIYDIQDLVKFMEDVMVGAEEWDATASGGLGMLIATALSINADGAAEEHAKRESFFRGTIQKRMTLALERTKEVKEKLNQTNALFTNLIDQMDAAGASSESSDTVNAMINQNILHTTDSLKRTERLPHTYLGTEVMTRMSRKIYAHLKARGNG